MRFEIFNLGNSRTEDLMSVVSIIEKKLGKKALVQFEDMQPGDVKKTFANIDKAKTKLGYSPSININEGISRFLDWYLTYIKS